MLDSESPTHQPLPLATTPLPALHAMGGSFEERLGEALRRLLRCSKVAPICCARRCKPWKIVKFCRMNYNVLEHFSPEESGGVATIVGAIPAAAEMYQVVGRNEDRCLRRLRRLYDASEPLHMKHKYLWERRYMCQHDKKKHRPKHWLWSAPKFLRSGSPASSTLEDLKRLLERWKHSLKLA